MSDRKEFNDFCDKYGITNLTAGLQLFEQCYDKLKMSFVKDTDSLHSDGVVETSVETDFNKMYVNAERAMILRYINNIAWEKLDTKELRKLYILIGNELESHCQKNKLYDCQRYDCPHYSEKVDPDNDPCFVCKEK